MRSAQVEQKGRSGTRRILYAHSRNTAQRRFVNQIYVKERACSRCLPGRKMLLGCSPPCGVSLPCLLKGSGIYCNAIVLDGIGPVPTLMMPPSLNLESLLPCWRPYVGRKGHVEGTE